MQPASLGRYTQLASVRGVCVMQGMRMDRPWKEWLCMMC